MVSGQQILKKFPHLFRHISGDLGAQATQTCSCEDPQKNSLCFIPSKQWLAPCFKVGVSIVVIHSHITVPDSPPSCCVLSTPMVSFAMSALSKEFFNIPPPQMDGHQVHPSAVISQSAQLGEGIVVGPHAVIADGVSIGSHSYIGAGSYVGPHSKVGPYTRIEPNVTIQHKVVIGSHCRIQSQSTVGSDGYGYGRDDKGRFHFKPHYGQVVLEDFVEVGAGSQIDRGVFKDTVVGEGTKIDNLCHIAHNVVIGKNCLLLGGVMIGGSCRIGNRCLLGGQTRIRDHINIVDDVRCTHSLVLNHITQPGSYGFYGNISLKQNMKAFAALFCLPKLQKKVEKLWAQRS